MKKIIMLIAILMIAVCGFATEVYDISFGDDVAISGESLKNNVGKTQIDETHYLYTYTVADYFAGTFPGYGIVVTTDNAGNAIDYTEPQLFNAVARHINVVKVSDNKLLCNYMAEDDYYAWRFLTIDNGVITFGELLSEEMYFKHMIQVDDTHLLGMNEAGQVGLIEFNAVDETATLLSSAFLAYDCSTFNPTFHKIDDANYLCTYTYG